MDVGLIYNEVTGKYEPTNSRGTATPLVTEAGTQTLTNKTVTAPVLSGSVTGTYTLAGTPTITSPTVTGAILSDYKVLAASETYDADTTPGLITGMAWTVVAGGTYIFDADFATTMTTNAGLTLAFKLTTATLTSIRYNTYATTATDNGTAVSTTGTTTTDLTEPFNSKTAAYTRVRMYGSFVVNAGGTFSLYGCQETSGTGGDVTILLIGSTAKLQRVA